MSAEPRPARIAQWGNLAEAATFVSACSLVTLAVRDVAALDILNGGRGFGAREVVIGVFCAAGVLSFASGLVALVLGEGHRQSTASDQGKVALGYSFLAMVFATVVIRVF